MINKYPIRSIFFFSFLLYTCQCKKETISIDPCKNISPFIPNFIIRENALDSIGTDTVLIYTTVNFEAPEKYQQFEWKIGNDTRVFTGRSLTLLFDDINTSTGELINVTLIGKGFYDPCFPEKNGKNDTIYKNFRIIAWKDAPIIGKYEGYFNSDKSKKQTIEVRYIDTIPAASCSGKFGCFRLFNINKDCNTTITNPGIYPLNVTIDVGKGAKFLSFDAFSSSRDFSNNCKAPKGFIMLSPTNRDSITAIFTYSESMTNSGNRLHDRFVGRRKF